MRVVYGPGLELKPQCCNSCGYASKATAVCRISAFVKTWSHWRTPELQVVSFFEHYHIDTYRVYNLCAEPNRQYSVITPLHTATSHAHATSG